MIAAFIFIMILLSLLFCCSFSQMYYQEGFDNSIGSTGSTGSTGSSGSVDGSLHYDNRYEERRRLMDNPITTNDEYNAILRSMNLSGSTGSTGSIGLTGSSGSTGGSDDDYNNCKIKRHNNDDVDEYNHYESNHHNNNGYDSDNYILKTMIVPPICPACPSIIYPDANAFKSIEECKKTKCNNNDKSKKQPTPAPSLAPTQSNASSHSNMDAWATTPYPILKDFTTYGM